MNSVLERAYTSKLVHFFPCVLNIIYSIVDQWWKLTCLKRDSSKDTCRPFQWLTERGFSGKESNRRDIESGTIIFRAKLRRQETIFCFTCRTDPLSSETN